MTSIRLATPQDIPAVCTIDAMVLGSTSRSSELKEAIEQEHCYLALIDMNIVGFAIINQSFFKNSFIHLIIVHPHYQNQGVGEEMMRYLETISPTEKLFTSTNLSNEKMQRLCLKLGYAHCGTLTHLDPDDPEMFFCKYVRHPL
ncbi:GNAT family N-acetyltransferase [Brevibacillus sp. DP1.3A]|uniref:GNAT family N-acetyltransferase n=1 Tax=Brevibacillus sp. DP1.3A TaxID=2738867 RepID=UPI00156ABFD7|nr:GNAT family N-acetyltransferase [Brevibacillus sp. DP1.3A]UED75106.1 GNAT family N-acetyltransferase [Brevibacillus sp. DP1.3A]